MRHSTLALTAMVSLSVGLLPTRIAAQKNEDAAPNRLAAPPLRVATQRFPAPKAADLMTPPPIDCAMPLIKGDPKIDPKFAKPLPPDAATHALILIPVPRCPDPAR